jgi:hypothetical protein
MCMSSPSAPKAPPPLPMQAPPPPPVVLDTAEGESTKNALLANRGRGSLRIDRTGMNTGASGSGLNIPT